MPPLLVDEPMSFVPCPRCLACLDVGVFHSIEAVLPLPRFPSLARDGSGACRRDCEAADLLDRISSALSFTMARSQLPKQGASKFRIPGVPLGLVGDGIVKMQRPRRFRQTLGLALRSISQPSSIGITVNMFARTPKRKTSGVFRSQFGRAVYLSSVDVNDLKKWTFSDVPHEATKISRRPLRPELPATSASRLGHQPKADDYERKGSPDLEYLHLADDIDWTVIAGPDTIAAARRETCTKPAISRSNSTLNARQLSLHSGQIRTAVPQQSHVTQSDRSWTIVENG